MEPVSECFNQYETFFNQYEVVLLSKHYDIGHSMLTFRKKSEAGSSNDKRDCFSFRNTI